MRASPPKSRRYCRGGKRRRVKNMSRDSLSAFRNRLSAARAVSTARTASERPKRTDQGVRCSKKCLGIGRVTFGKLFFSRKLNDGKPLLACFQQPVLNRYDRVQCLVAAD